jgi:hypothetical protein
MKKNKILFIAMLSFCVSVNVIAQTKGPKIIIKKEFCPPAEYENDGEDMQSDKQSVVNEKLLKNVIATLDYNKVLKKLNNEYTITKWKIKNTHNPKQIDTFIIITYARQSDRLVYYKLNKAAGKNAQTPGLINATLGRDELVPSPFKFGMKVQEVEKIIQAPKGDMRDNSTIYITDEPGNSFINLSFIESDKNLILTGFSYSGYWD